MKNVTAEVSEQAQRAAESFHIALSEAQRLSPRPQWLGISQTTVSYSPMSWRDALHELIWGTPFRPEYLCTPYEPHPSGLRIIDQDGKDVTGQHVFLGYRPLLLGFWEIDNPKPIVHLSWQTPEEKGLAVVDLEFTETINWEEQQLHIYTGTRGIHKFLSLSQQWRHNLRQRVRGRRDSAYLTPEIYNQVKAAYAIPRKISVASVLDDAKGNVFPTDLNGPIQNGYYAISLREAGKAHQQVLKTGRMLLAEMHVSQAANVYQLGKNHMRDLRPLDELSEAPERIGEYPVLEGVTRYRLMERITGKTCSIHHIHIFRIVEEKVLDPEAKVLAHIHRDYATWRWRNRLPTEYVDR